MAMEGRYPVLEAVSRFCVLHVPPDWTDNASTGEPETWRVQAMARSPLSHITREVPAMGFVELSGMLEVFVTPEVQP